jgi:4-amino-4-deoxy-L-arabinose transferase-like glycosyltransferase
VRLRSEAASGHGRRVLAAVVFVVSLALRVIPVDRPLDMDEALWVRRGGVFFSALLRGDPAETYVRPHPGVLSMWVLGAADTAWCQAVSDPAKASWRSCADAVGAEIYPTLPYFIVGRLIQAFLTSALLAAICVVVSGLFGLRVGWLTAAILALEPFFVGFQRFVTTDALACDLSAVAWLFFLLHLGDRRRRYLLISAVAFALAAINKVPTILLLPALLASIVMSETGVWPASAKRGWAARASDLALWAGAAALTAFLVWPALWRAPLSTYRRFRLDLWIEKTEGSHLFLPSDEHPLRFYWLVVALRLSPIVHAGCLLSLAAMVRRRVRGLPPLAGGEQLALLALSGLVLLRLAGDTARDRYMLFVVPPLAAMAALGYEAAIRWLESRDMPSAAGPLAILALAAGESGLLWVQAPDYVTFYNPLLGGTPQASRMLALGQGEGLDRAALWLNAQPGAESQVVASALAWAFSPYFHGRTIPVPLDYGSSRAWLSADRIVLYVWQVQVGSPDPFSSAYLWSQPPLHAIRLHGVDYVRIYKGPIVLPEVMPSFGPS